MQYDPFAIPRGYMVTTVTVTICLDCCGGQNARYGRSKHRFRTEHTLVSDGAYGRCERTIRALRTDHKPVANGPYGRCGRSKRSAASLLHPLYLSSTTYIP